VRLGSLLKAWYSNRLPRVPLGGAWRTRIAEKNSQNPESYLDEAPAPPATDFNENSRFEQAWADEECIYDGEEYQRIEDALPCDPSVDKTQFRPKFRKMAIGLIADSLKRVDTVDNSAARDELVEIRKWLDWSLMRFDSEMFPLSAAGQRLAQAARDSSAPWQEIPVLLASVRKLRDYCETAIDGIPARNPRQTESALLGLTDFWHEVTGYSALTENEHTSFETFEKFAAAIIEPLQKAGYSIPKPNRNQVASLLNHR